MYLLANQMNHFTVQALFNHTSHSNYRNHASRAKRLGAVLFCSVIISAGLFLGCSQEAARGPKQVVIKLFGAMERNEKAAVANALDLVALLKIRDRDYALNLDSLREMRTPTAILDDLTGEGKTKLVWFSLQRVVGAEEIIGDTAYVEVSFVNKETGMQYYNKFGLHKIGEIWRIYSFRTPIDISDESQ